MKDKKKILIMWIGLFLILVIGVSYAYWLITKTQSDNNIVNSKCFSVSFEETSSGINLDKAFPILDSEGMTLEPYTFTITNTCDADISYAVNLETLNTTTLDTQYIKAVLNNDTPKVLSSYDSASKTLANASLSNTLKTGSLRAGASVTYSLRLWMDEDTPLDAGQNKTFASKIVVVNTPVILPPTLADTILAAAGGTAAIEAKGTPSFSAVSTTNDGMYMAEDDYGKSYYYRGAVTNNNIIFGGFCWKIIRVNGNGTVRMIYNGTPTNNQCTTQTGTATQIGTSSFNSSSSKNAYVGYMYGTAGSSTYAAEHANTNSSIIKQTIDTWYTNNLATYASYLSDTLFCNDRSVAESAGMWDSSDKALGYGTNRTYYGPYSRTYSEYSATTKNPSLKCANKNDRFTVSDTTGNGALTNPIALITIDEAYFAGGYPGEVNTSFYLYTGQSYWSLSPYYFSGSYATGFLVDGLGYLISNGVGIDVGDSRGVRPVISLKADTMVSQDGTGESTNPYIVS